MFFGRRNFLNLNNNIKPIFAHSYCVRIKVRFTFSFLDFFFECLNSNVAQCGRLVGTCRLSVRKINNLIDLNTLVQLVILDLKKN